MADKYLPFKGLDENEPESLDYGLYQMGEV
jgi:hypothetical protein